MMAAQPAGAVDTGRADMQDWTNFALFLTSAEWEVLQGRESQLRKIDCVARYLAQLGLRHPSEKNHGSSCIPCCCCGRWEH